MIASLAFAAALAAASSSDSKAVAPMTLEQKAGCGIALTMMGDGFEKLGLMKDMQPAERSMVKMLVRSMSDQGRAMLSEAFAEGAQRQMTSMQIFDAGVKDLYTNISPTDLEQPTGDATLNLLMERCAS